jgi:hypothetical protein
LSQQVEAGEPHEVGYHHQGHEGRQVLLGAEQFWEENEWQGAGWIFDRDVRVRGIAGLNYGLGPVLIHRDYVERDAAFGIEIGVRSEI